MTSIAKVIVRESPATIARRQRFERAKRMPSNTAHWFYKHAAENKTPYNSERVEKERMEQKANADALDFATSRYNTLTRHVFDGIAHLVYGWPHMADAAALIALEET